MPCRETLLAPTGRPISTNLLTLLNKPISYLRGDGVEELGADGQTDLTNVEEEGATDAEALVHAEGTIDVSISHSTTSCHSISHSISHTC